MLMPDVVHDQASGQRERQFRERRDSRMRRRRDEARYLRRRRRSRLFRRTRRLSGRGIVVEQSFPGAAIEHGLHVLPRVHHLVRRIPGEFHVTTPRVEVGGVRLHVLVRRADSMRVEDELVGGEEEAAVGALDALCAGAVVTSGEESAAAAPGAFVVHREREVFREP